MNSIGEQRLAHLINELVEYDDLRELNLRRSSIGREECLALAKMLVCPTTKLLVLDISHSTRQFEDGCMALLTEALASNNTLKKLYFGYMAGNMPTTNIQYLNITASTQSLGQPGVTSSQKS